MDLNEETEKNYKIIKNRLTNENIKLWLPPFLKDNGKKSSRMMKKLAEALSRELSISKELCLQYIELLQMKAIINFVEMSEYKNMGIASLKVRVFYEMEDIFLTVGISLSKRGYDLKLKISNVVAVSANRLKLIFRGKFLKDGLVLREQGVKHGLHILGVVVKENCEIFNPVYESNVEHLNVTMADIGLLLRGGYFQVPQQYQKLTVLASEQRKALVRAMRLHQIGRNEMKKAEFPTALVFLLEAENKYGECDPSLLNIFENYGVLTIDILWCYMNMQSIIMLPDAEDRLYQCECTFKETFGPNLEHINPFKESAWTALILYMRVHLAQVVVLYHQEKMFKAGILLKQVEEEIKGLEVDKSQLSRLVELGYGQTESRLALRETKGNFNKAVSKMQKRRKEMAKKKKEEEKAEKSVKKEQDPAKLLEQDQAESKLYKSLISMGCSGEISKWVIEQRRSCCTDASLEEGGSQDSQRVLKTIIDLGFKPKKARAALKKHEGSFDGAIKELFEKEFKLGFESYLEIDYDDEKENENEDEDEDEVEDEVEYRFEDEVEYKVEDEVEYKVENEAEDKDEVGDEDKDDDDDGNNAVGYSNEEEYNLHQTPDLEQDIIELLFPNGAENVQYDYVDTSLELEILFLNQYKTLLNK